MIGETINRHLILNIAIEHLRNNKSNFQCSIFNSQILEDYYDW
jgi:hypothetical protein